MPAPRRYPMLFLFRLLARFPLPLLHWTGAALGWLGWLFSPAYRRHFTLQADLAGVSPQDRRKAIGAAGMGLLELPKLWMRPQGEIVARVVEVSGWPLVEEAWARGKGIVFLTPHLGCFEITAQYYAARRPMTVLYRRPKRGSLAPVIEAGRGAHLKLAPADLSGVRALLKALKAGEAVGMLPDQVPGEGEGAWLPFFGKPAYTMTLAARLCDTGATPLMAYAERLPGGRGYHLKLFPLNAPLDGSLEDKAAAINKALESMILDCPGQYLWGYNRYKRPRGAPPPPPTPDRGKNP